MLSRVESLEQIFILNSIPENSLRTSSKAMTELVRMNKDSLNNNPIAWDSDTPLLKAVFLNCMNMKKSIHDIRSDPTLKEAELIFLAETWLQVHESLSIENYLVENINVGNGKGLSIFIKNSSTFKLKAQIKKEKLQIAKYSNNDIDIIGVYRSSLGSLNDLHEELKRQIEQNKDCVILGDFNWCCIENRNKVSQYLEAEGFTQLVTEATHRQGRAIDHCYVKLQENEPYLHFHANYYSDHSALCLALVNKQGEDME